MCFTAFPAPSGFDTGVLAAQVVCCDGHMSGARLHGWFLTVRHQESETVDTRESMISGQDIQAYLHIFLAHKFTTSTKQSQ
jgi:hypothetical protein